MKLLVFLLSISILTISTASAAESADEDILATRGKGVVTQLAFSAQADKIPANIRKGTLRDTNRLRDVINSLLLRAQLAADAQDAGFADQAIIKERMRLAAQAELGEAWLQNYVATQPAADYEVLAREYYQLNQASMLSEPKIDVSQILISTEQHSEAEAQEIAATVSQKLAADPASFDDLVGQYSEDPSAASNRGKFTGVKRGELVKPFEEVAFELSEGEISAPVKTGYGYHIIRLDAHIPSTRPEFNAVKDKLIKAERKRHEDRVRSDYLNNLSNRDALMSKEALEELVRRLVGEDGMDAPVDGAESE